MAQNEKEMLDAPVGTGLLAKMERLKDEREKEVLKAEQDRDK